jgi:hypothetical protein
MPRFLIESSLDNLYINGGREGWIKEHRTIPDVEEGTWKRDGTNRPVLHPSYGDFYAEEFLKYIRGNDR